jgi:hypothetical protein
VSYPKILIFAKQSRSTGLRMESLSQSLVRTHSTSCGSQEIIIFPLFNRVMFRMMELNRPLKLSQISMRGKLTPTVRKASY